MTDNLKPDTEDFKKKLSITKIQWGLYVMNMILSIVVVTEIVIETGNTSILWAALRFLFGVVAFFIKLIEIESVIFLIIAFIQIKNLIQKPNTVTLVNLGINISGLIGALILNIVSKMIGVG